MTWVKTSKRASILITQHRYWATRSFSIVIRKTFDIHQLLTLKLKFTCCSSCYLWDTFNYPFIFGLFAHKSTWQWMALKAFDRVFWGVCFRTLTYLELFYWDCEKGSGYGKDLSKLGWTLWPTYENTKKSFSSKFKYILNSEPKDLSANKSRGT